MPNKTKKSTGRTPKTPGTGTSPISLTFLTEEEKERKLARDYWACTDTFRWLYSVNELARAVGGSADTLWERVYRASRAEYRTVRCQECGRAAQPRTRQQFYLIRKFGHLCEDCTERRKLLSGTEADEASGNPIHRTQGSHPQPLLSALPIPVTTCPVAYTMSLLQALHPDNTLWLQTELKDGELLVSVGLPLGGQGFEGKGVGLYRGRGSSARTALDNLLNAISSALGERGMSIVRKASKTGSTP
jgi:hypothetical protein